MNIRYPIYEGVYRILTIKTGLQKSSPVFIGGYTSGHVVPLSTVKLFTLSFGETAKCV